MITAIVFINAEVDGEWSCPIGGAEGHRRRLDAVEQSKTSLVPFEDRRDLPVHHRPAR